MKHSRLWTGLSAIFCALLVTALIANQTLTYYASTVNQALGIETSRIENPKDVNAADLTHYPSEYGELTADHLQALIADTYAESVVEEEEGAVLLENRNSALPLAEGERSVTLFGHAVAQPLYRSNAAGSKGYTSEYGIDLYKALTNAGFKINDALFNAYKASSFERKPGGVDIMTQQPLESALGEADSAFYTDSLKASWSDDYNDVAIVMFAREGAEGAELPGGVLAFQQEERDLMQMIKDSGKFGKVIVLLNTANAVELEWLDEFDVDACLWIGEPGEVGFTGVVNLLTGKSNPSGRLTDTFAVSADSAPANVNGSWNSQTWANVAEVLAATDEAPSGHSQYTVQAEGIYVGYKYYETRYEDAVLGQGGADAPVGSIDGAAWDYDHEVRYPFGYGLSYTDFTETLDGVTMNGDDIDVTVTVTNTGSVAGKFAVQVYAQTPYGDYERANRVEKSAIQLLDFGKTGLLQPGASETLTITCDKYLLASYDYIGAKGYILSQGDYYIAVGSNVHDALNNILTAKGAADAGNAELTYHWTQAQLDAESYRHSRATGEEVTNQFGDADLNAWIDNGVTYLSRSDWAGTYPAAPVIVTATAEMIAAITGNRYEKPADAPSVSTITLGDNKNIPLAALMGLDYDDPQWDTYLNQFTLDELASVVSDTIGTAEIVTVGKPAIAVGDGPDGINVMFSQEKYGDGREACCYPSEIVLASTFNKELLENRGRLLAEECMYLNIPMVWMPGANLHRTPYGGRNFEYYSEDAIMTYLCTVPTVKAMESRGVHAGPKHFAGNDQENGRMGVSVFFNEQAFREGSLKGFEGSVAVAQAHAMMHGYNRIGMTWCSYSDALCHQVLENEWGFVGEQETDATAGLPGQYFSHYDKSLVNGVDSFCLDFGGGGANAVKAAITENDDGYLLGALRKSAHDYLYIMTNSILMNGVSTEAKIVSITPYWVTLMNALIAALAVLSIASIAILLRKNTSRK